MQCSLNARGKNGFTCQGSHQKRTASSISAGFVALQRVHQAGFFVFRNSSGNDPTADCFAQFVVLTFRINGDDRPSLESIAAA